MAQSPMSLPRRQTVQYNNRGLLRGSTAILLVWSAFGCDGNGRSPANVGATDIVEEGGTRPRAATFALRDSAGIRIVENSAPEWQPGEGWVVANSPSVHIGLIDGAPEYQFTAVQNAWRNSDGSITVVERRTAPQVRTFDSNGRFVKAFGRDGDGPGEFRAITFASRLRADSVLVTQTGRIGVFDQNGTPVRTRSIDLPWAVSGSPTAGWGMRGAGRFLGAFEDGSLLALPHRDFYGYPGAQVPMPIQLYRYSPDGEPLGEVVDFMGPEQRMADVSRMAGRIQLPLRPYYQVMVFAVAGEYFFMGYRETFEIEKRDQNGVLLQIIRSSHLDLTLTESHREIARETRRTQNASWRDVPLNVRERAIDEMEFPERLPPYRAALVDADGFLWVAHFRVTGFRGAHQWSVFAEDGHLLGIVETPSQFEVREIGSDYVLGIWTDEFEVPHVRMYALNRRDSVYQ